LNRLRNEMFRYRLVSVAEIAFQACSIDHSDISPFRINHLRAVWNSVAQNPPSDLIVAQSNLIQRFTAGPGIFVAEIVSDLLMCRDQLGQFP
jgi:hypothetical protein